MENQHQIEGILTKVHSLDNEAFAPDFMDKIINIAREIQKESISKSEYKWVTKSSEFIGAEIGTATNTFG